MKNNRVSLLFPAGVSPEDPDFRILPKEAIHDLGLDSFCEKLSDKPAEKAFILTVISRMTNNPRVALYRSQVFADLNENTQMSERLISILDKVDFLREFGSFRRDHEGSDSVWDLVHRLEEINDYIGSIKAIRECLSCVELHSEGLKGLLAYVDDLYNEKGFAELERDVLSLKATTSNLKSVTVGINLNERFEADTIGLVSVNSKAFTKSGIIGSFQDKISTREGVQDSTEWDGSNRYHPVAESFPTAGLEAYGKMNLRLQNPLFMATLGNIGKPDQSWDITSRMDQVTSHMLTSIVKKLKLVLTKYVSVTITDVANLIPEIIFYVRFSQFVRNRVSQGYRFCSATLLDGVPNDSGLSMDARGIFNLKLLDAVSPSDIVLNDLAFDRSRTVYVLTGANRGGKTTITQAVGQAFVLAQCGVPVPGTSFAFKPIDCVYTHFPADEDKTLDLGRLGEECSRFRELFAACTSDSLLLLNETFSTTSFEEGYYIARDSVKAIMEKGIRTIYNTHMHKLAFDIPELNVQASGCGTKAASLVVRTEEGERSFRICVDQPEGLSYANDIARKYGVTYELLMGGNHV